MTLYKAPCFVHGVLFLKSLIVLSNAKTIKQSNNQPKTIVPNINSKFFIPNLSLDLTFSADLCYTNTVSLYAHYYNAERRTHYGQYHSQN